MELNNKYIRFDWAMKRMLRDKANFVILEGLVSQLVGEGVSLTELIGEDLADKGDMDWFYKIRLAGRNCDGAKIIVEVRVLRYYYHLKRIVLKERGIDSKVVCCDERYKDVRKVYSINIFYYGYGKGGDYLYRGKTNFVGVHTGDSLCLSTLEIDEIKMNVPDDVLPEYYILLLKNFNRIVTTPLDEWLDYLKNNHICDITMTSGLCEARSKFLCAAMTDKERRAYERHLDDIMVENDVLDTARMEGLIKARAEVIAEGRAEAMKLMVKNMCGKGMSHDVISDVTGLSHDEIERMMKE